MQIVIPREEHLVLVLGIGLGRLKILLRWSLLLLSQSRRLVFPPSFQPKLG
ncbi:hypothetical protein HanIR_Chr05g0218891 [Helianthus annuus]|nr:hypothetical protein HanIR_Chr05g0218891 [Helianthus annuus]